MEIAIYAIIITSTIISVLFLYCAFKIFSTANNAPLGHQISVKKNNTVLDVGVGLFPDSMVLPVGIESGFFDKLHIDIRVQYLDWDDIFDSLVAEDVSIIIANKSICDYKNSAKTFFAYHQDLHFYNAFAILFRPTKNLRTFLEIRNDSRSSPDDVIVDTLKQLKDLDIIASHETDHSMSLMRCAERANLSINKDYNIIGKFEPNEGLQQFLFNNVGDAYVGGISQRIIAQRNGMQTLISQDQVDLGETQRNGFITLIQNPNISQKIINKLIYAWFRTVQAINDDKDHAYTKNLLTHLNSNLIKYDLNYEFTMDDFSLYWNRWEKFPTTVKESEQIREKVITMGARH